MDLLLSRPHGLEDFDLASYINIVRLRRQASIQHRGRCDRKWACHVNDAGNVRQAIGELLWVVEREDSSRKAESGGQRSEGNPIAPSKDDVEVLVSRELRCETAGVTVSTIQ